jgi:hypothetical protein
MEQWKKYVYKISLIINNNIVDLFFEQYNLIVKIELIAQ